jgi:hypothetical protein
MRFLISTLCTTAAIAVLAACSGNMATMPSTNYQLPSRIASNEPAAAPSQVKPMGENGWSQCTDPIWGTFWLQITPSQSDEFIGWYQVISGYVRTSGDDKYDGHVIYNPVKISWANMNLDVKAFWNGKCVGTCGLSANDASSTVEVSHVSPKNSKLLASFDTCSACIITGLAVAKDQTLLAAVEPASSSSASSIYVWSYGSTSPSAILQGQSGLTGVGVAIDASKNVYWTANAPKGSGTTGELWEYPYEASGTYGSPTLLQSTSKIAGIVGPNAEGMIAYSLPSAGEVAVGKPGGSGSYIKTGGNPEALSLDSTGTALMVTDPVNNRVSTYTFPGGKPISSWSVHYKKHGKVIPTSMTSYLPPK